MHKAIREQLEQACKSRFGEQTGWRLFFAPGRVNLIGEHTDYNGGYVFPAALTFGTYAIIRLRDDGTYRFRSVQFEREVDVAVDDVVFREEDDWANYPKGVLSELLQWQNGAYAASLRAGADVVYLGNVPNGAGLSSSASIELVTGYALTQLTQIPIGPIELVQLAQRAENRFVGVNCGIMDQFAVGMGKEDHAMLLQCDTLAYDYVPVRTGDYQLVIANTNKRRGLADSKYNERRAQCEEGLALLQQKLPQLANLGQLTLAEWEANKAVLTDDVIHRRVRHVVTEIARVLEARDCLAQDDLSRFGQLMIASHVSLRDDYEVTGTELDALLEAACAVEGCIGSRMTGAGFGGCTVSLVHASALETFQRDVTAQYEAKTGLTPSFYVCQIGDGVQELV